MRDPIPPPSPYLFNLTKPYADLLGFQTLPYHIHEVLFAFVFYQSIQSVFSPVFSTFFFPDIYPKMKPRTRINWDVHVVSLAQSCLINTLALWVMFTDAERYDMKDSPIERIYGYTGASGLIQGMAAGYFLWDLVVSTRYVKMFGWGIWAHAISALLVYSFGFRPFANYYGPVFILYELSSPFLNIHWFCDKLNLTGSKIQWYNGMLLLGTFFGCRLIWGTYQSLRVYQDVWHVLHLDTKSAFALGQNVANSAAALFSHRDGQLCLGNAACIADQIEVMKFASHDTSKVPVWLAGVYLTTNTILNALNFYWFGKMIETVSKRFKGAPHDEFKHEKDIRRPSMIEEAATSLDRGVLSGPITPGVELRNPMGKISMSSGVSTVDNTGELHRR